MRRRADNTLHVVSLTNPPAHGAPSISSGPPARRGAVTALAATVLAVTLGLLAWGPMPIEPQAQRYADGRAWLNVPNALNVLTNLPVFWLAVWGWCATHTSTWPRSLRVPMQWFHLSALVTSLISASHHATPNDAMYVLVAVGQAISFGMLALALFSDRLDHRFGSAAACACGATAFGLAGAAMLYAGPASGATDLRPLVLLEVASILFILMGALNLPGAHTLNSNWVVLLFLYALSRILGFGDAVIFRTTGWISGHSLMHLSLAATVGWVAYWASVVPRRGDAGRSPSAQSQRHTSLNTTA